MIISNKKIPDEVESPFKEKKNLILIDMTKHTGISGRALRVELRRIRNPATGPVKPEKKIVDHHHVIGLISREALPTEGVNFKMAYHRLSGIPDFGNIDSREPVSNVSSTEGCFYFETSEGHWRLKILNIGN